MTEDFREKVKSISVMKRSPQSAIEKRWEKDMPAYRRLRKEGLQPKNVDGSYELEQRAHDRFEIEMGHLVEKPDDREKYHAAIDRGRGLQLGDLV